MYFLYLDEEYVGASQCFQMAISEGVLFSMKNLLSCSL